MSTKIYITGYGAIAALGNNVAEIKASLFAQKTGIRQGDKPYSEKYKVGEIRFSNAELIEHFDLKNDASRTALLGMVAAKEAFKNHVLHPDIRTGLISGTSVGGMDVSEKEYLKFLNSEPYSMFKFKLTHFLLGNHAHFNIEFQKFEIRLF
jgi:3-oxoacyl-[acyl-carrier-protein] synthase-1